VSVLPWTSNVVGTASVGLARAKYSGEDTTAAITCSSLPPLCMNAVHVARSLDVGARRRYRR
jgi:hypothetical protein